MIQYNRKGNPTESSMMSLTSALSTSTSTSRSTKTSTRTSSQVPTPTVPPLGEALPEAATPVLEKTDCGSDNLAEIKKVMAKLLASVTAINEQVRAVEGGFGEETFSD